MVLLAARGAAHVVNGMAEIEAINIAMDPNHGFQNERREPRDQGPRLATAIITAGLLGNT